MFGQVCYRAPEEDCVVLQESECAVAGVAKQAPDGSGRVAVVDDELVVAGIGPGRSFAAERADAPLLAQKRIVFGQSHAVEGLEIGLAFHGACASRIIASPLRSQLGSAIFALAVIYRVLRFGLFACDAEFADLLFLATPAAFFYFVARESIAVPLTWLWSVPILVSFCVAFLATGLAAVFPLGRLGKLFKGFYERAFSASPGVWHTPILAGINLGGE